MAQKKGNRYFVWIIMILLFIGLLGFGTGGLGGNIRSIGSAGDKDISVASYQRTLTDQIRAFEAQVGTRIGFQQAQAIGLDQVALGQLITTRTLDNETSQLGISIGDARVREEVLRVPAFRGLDGTFDREAYRSTLQRNGQTESEFETSIRDEISRTLLQGAVVGGIPGPAPYADALVDYVGEARDVVFATVTDADLTEPVPGPTEAELQEFYDANPELFTAPEQREISFAWLTPEMIQDTLDVDEDAVRALYDERISDFVRPERRLVERLVYIDPDAAQSAMDRLTAGEIDFEGLVAERGLDLSDVDMGDVALDELGGAGEAVFAAAPGDVVGPLDSTIGPALFRMNAVLAAEEITFEDAAPDLRNELSADRARRVIADTSDGLVDLLAGGASVADLAAQSNLEAGQITWDEDTTSGIAAYEAFRSAAADAEVGAFPELIELEDGGVFALELTAVTPPAVQPLEDVRSTARTAWIDTRRAEMILTKAQDLAGQIQPLTGFESLGLTPVEQIGMTRRSFVEGTPPAFALEVFDMSPGEVRAIESGANAVIIRLNRITPPDATDPAIIAEREAVAENAANGIAQDVFAAFAATVQNRTDVQLDQAVLNAVHAQLQ